MFEKLNQLKQIKAMHDALQSEKVELERDGVKIVLNGKFEVEEIVLNPQLSKEEQEKILKKCFNEAIRKIQLVVVQKLGKII